MKKHLLKFMLFVMIFSFNCSVYAQNNDIKVVIDGEQVQFDVAPQIMDGRTMLPVRAIFEKLGATIDWDAEAKAVNAKKDNTVITLIVDSKTMYVNGNEKTLDVPATIKDGRTLVPVRAISEAFGNQVGWDGKLKTVSIIKDASNYKMLYAAGEREKLFNNSEVTYQLTQGWYNEPLADVSKNIAQIEGFIKSGKYLEAMQECENLKVYNVSEETRSKIDSLYNDAKNKYDVIRKNSITEAKIEIYDYLLLALNYEKEAKNALDKMVAANYYGSGSKSACMESLEKASEAYKKAYSVSSEHYELDNVSSKIKQLFANIDSVRKEFNPNVLSMSLNARLGVLEKIAIELEY